MKKRRLFGLFMALMLIGAASCSVEDRKRVVPPEEPRPYYDLSQKDHVLYNLQKAFVERNIDRYDQLLDDAFVFHFSEADYIDGSVPVESWDRAAEIASTHNLFNRNFSKPGVDPISKIDLTMVHAEGNDGWTPVAPHDPQTYPNETWYKKTVIYDLEISSGPVDYTAHNVQATFVVRWAVVSNVSIWRIISWEDDTQTPLARSSDCAARGSSLEPTTWGQVKSLYR